MGRYSLPDLCFLNRFALDELAHPHAVDPYFVLRNIYKFAQPDELLELFQHYCDSALSGTYDWKEGSPGNLLFFAEKLEQLFEAVFLIQQGLTKKQKKRFANRMRSIDTSKLPVNLSEREFAQPLLVFDRFYSYNNLPQWKLALQNWTHAALSNHSVSENVELFTIMPFIKHIEKLIAAAYWISKIN